MRDEREPEQKEILCETERLLLRYQQMEDEEPLIDLWTDPQVTRYLGGPRNRETLQPLLRETTADPRADQYDLWVLVIKKTGMFAGHCGLLEKTVEGKREIELVYILAADCWGNGYAGEIGSALIRYAFEEKRLSRVICLIEPENRASEKVAIQLGMHLEKIVTRQEGDIRKLYVREREDDE